MKRKHLIFIVLIIYIVLLFIGATIYIPNDTTPSFRGFDKIVHFTQFFIFAIILLLFLQNYKKTHKNIYIIGALIGIIVLSLTELSQIFITYRHFSFYDLVANFLGFTSGMVIHKWMFFRQ
jgi:VanZ family protein